MGGEEGCDGSRPREKKSRGSTFDLHGQSKSQFDFGYMNSPLTPQKLLVKARNVKASARGIVAVSENGDETPVEPPKRRGRPRKTTTEEPEVEPATKRSRQSTRLSKTPAPTEPDDAPITPLPSVPSLPDLAELPEPQVKKKGKGRAKEVEGDDGDTAGIEDGPEKVSAVKVRIGCTF